MGYFIINWIIQTLLFSPVVRLRVLDCSCHEVVPAISAGKIVHGILFLTAIFNDIFFYRFPLTFLNFNKFNPGPVTN